MSGIRIILFDWGNTLVCVRREDQAWARCARAAVRELAKQGLDPPESAGRELGQSFGSARRRSMRDPAHQELELESVVRDWLTQRHPGAAVTPAVCSAVATAFWQAWTDCLDILDGSDVVLRRLAERGYELGLVSNVSAPGDHCRVQLQRLGLLPWLSTLTLSSDLGVRKPHPRIYQEALAQLRARRGGDEPVADEILFVGDSPECDIAGPARLGWRTALLQHPEVVAPWPAEDYARVKPTWRVRRLVELEGFL